MSSRVNHLAVLVSAIVFLLLSWLWYSLIFAQMYATAIGAAAAAAMKTNPMTMPMIETFLLGWALAYVIGIALSMRTEANPMQQGIGFGVFIGLGVFGSMSLLGVIWGGLPFSLWAINTGFVVVAMAIMGAIIGAWKSRAVVA